MKKVLLITLSILLGSVLLFAVVNWDSTANYLKLSANNTNLATNNIGSNLKNKIQKKANALYKYAKTNGYDTSLFFIIDMEQESGKRRFFVFDHTKNEIINASLVTHGRCNESALKGRKYTNVVGGGCTSLGRYKIGNSYIGKFGLAYKLHGLDATNSNAFERFVVLHSHECVPEGEVAPYPICQSDGCPTVSPQFLQVLAAKIDKSKKPILLEIFDDNFQ